MADVEHDVAETVNLNSGRYVKIYVMTLPAFVAIKAELVQFVGDRFELLIGKFSDLSDEDDTGTEAMSALGESVRKVLDKVDEMTGVFINTLTDQDSSTMPALDALELRDHILRAAGFWKVLDLEGNFAGSLLKQYPVMGQLAQQLTSLGGSGIGQLLSKGNSSEPGGDTPTSSE